MTTAGTARRALAIFALSFASLFIWVPAASAAAPANDAFADATALPEFPGEQSGSNLEATKETGEPNHAGNPGGHSVWYSWTPSSSRRISIQNGNCFGGTDIVIAVYTGSSVDALTPVASNQTPSSPGCFFSEAPHAEFEATAGTTYWIAVDGRDGAHGNFNLRFNGEPGNDDFADATTLGAAVPQNVFSTTKLGSKEAGEPNHAGDPGGHSVWFAWTPTASEPVRIATCTSSSSIDAVLSVYTGSEPNALTEVASNDETTARLSFGGCKEMDSSVTVNAVAGTTYRIAVDGANGTAGRFNLRIQGRPANDDFDSPQVLAPQVPAFASEAGNEFATEETGEPDHAGFAGGHSVWFSWTAPSSGRVRISTCDSEGLDLDTVLAVYTGSELNALTPVAANDDGPRSRCGDLQSELDLTVTAGTTYRIAVDGKNGNRGRFGLSIEGPAGNDDFANPSVLPGTLNISTASTNSLASKEAGEPNHAGSPGSSSVWFSWTAPSSGPVSISICPYFENSPDTMLAVYTGSALGGLTPVAASDDSPAACQEVGSEVVVQAVAGTTYRIAVDSKDGSEGIFSLDLSGTPSNDGFAAAKVLSPGSFSDGGSNRFATKEAGEPDHAGDPGGHSLWFSWTPSESGPVDLYACGRQPGVDTLLSVYTGSELNALTPVAANDDVASILQDETCEPGNGNSEVVFQATAGTTYYFAVDTKESEGRFVLRLEKAPQNDDFAKAQPLFPGLPTFSSALTKLADKESGEPNHAGDAGGHSVWFSWTAPGSGPVAIQTCTHDASLDTVLGVYTGTELGSLTPVASDDDGQSENDCRSTDSAAELAATAGTTYLIAVDGKGGTSGSFQLIVEGVAANDDFGQAQPLGGNLPTSSQFFSNRFAGKQAGEPDHAGDAGGSSVWFKWTAPRSGTVSIDTCESGFDTLLAVYTGATLGSLVPVQSNDNGGGSCTPKSKLSFTAVANTTYRIAIDGKAGAQGALELHIEERPANDDFGAATTIPGRPGWYWPGSTLLATKQSGEPSHAGDPGGRSVWFSWTPRKSWEVELDLCTGSFDPLVGVYTGDEVDDLTPVVTTDAGSGECDEGESLGFTTVPGTTYRFAVDGAGGNEGHFLLHLRSTGTLPHTLSVSKAGSGGGSVSSSLAGISCGAICSHDFEEGTAVVLVADPVAGSTFAGWSGGGCSGTGPCQLAVNSDTSVTATFEGQPSGGGGGGGGSVIPAPISPPPLSPPTVQPPAKKPLKCKRGFKKKIVKGKPRCVKKKKKGKRRR